MKKRWTYYQSIDINSLAPFAQELRISVPLAQVLWQRNIQSFEAAKYFFRPELNHLHSPFLMKNMDKAVARLRKALEFREKILVYGDYDVDGTTSVALLFHFLKSQHAEVTYYIPDRHKEGYGVSDAGIEYAHLNGFNLLITLDCGIKSADKIERAASYGIDTIICDHHLPGGTIPNAVAVLDAKQTDCPYPFKELCGCGVTFKLVQAYCEQYGLNAEHYLQYLDLVMVATAADIVPMVGENRVLAHFGLKKLNSNPQLGLRQLMKNAGKSTNYTVTDAVFIIAPRINAAGRIGHAHDAVKLLLAEMAYEADDNSFEMNQKNEERKAIEKGIVSEAVQQIYADPQHHTQKTTVVFQPDWHKGVIGIVASKLIEQHFYRPTIVLTLSEGKITGSARSVKGFDLHEALVACADTLTQFGGHMAAAGLSMKPENLELFKKRFEAEVSQTITPEQLEPQVLIDADLHLENITANFFNVKEQMAPFGPQNMDPIFCSKNVQMVGYPRIVGENHLKISLKQDNSSIFDAIAFHFGHLEAEISPHQKFDICYHIEQNTYNNQTNLQLRIIDMICV